MHEFRPMGVPEILDATFRLYRDRFFTFLLIGLAVYLPFSLLAAYFFPLSMIEDSLKEGAGANQVAVAQFNMLAILPKLYGRLGLQLLFHSIGTAALSHNLSAAYLGREQSAFESCKRTAAMLVGLLWTLLLCFIATYIGACLFLIPTILCWIWFYVLVPVIVVERTTGVVALLRSRELISGNLGKTTLLGVLAIFLVWFLIFPLSSLINLVSSELPLLRELFQYLMSAFLLPILSAPPILLYYDLRIRREGFDLRMLADSMERAAAI